MKAVFQRLTTEPEEGFVFKDIRSASFDCPWHVHPEYELILVIQGKGYRIVGDNIARLSAGDMVLVGPGLPHIWQDEPPPNGRSSVHLFLVQFEERFLGEGLLRLPAMEPVRRLLQQSRRGLHVVGRTHTKVTALMNHMADLKGMARVLQFLHILVTLAGSEDCEPIASPNFAADSSLYDQERMDRVFQFLNSQLGQPVRLAEAAQIVHLSEGAFSRFFRLHTGKTFPEFVNELRIGRACSLLMEDNLNITEVAYECGFTNLSNFNRQFLRLKGVSPREFRLQLQQRLHQSRFVPLP
jgi:AraC-like DNA-binding protein/mannose-6-phosphate isomerase-like protein (cupin superfamily)